MCSIVANPTQIMSQVHYLTQDPHIDEGAIAHAQEIAASFQQEEVPLEAQWISTTEDPHLVRPLLLTRTRKVYMLFTRHRSCGDKIIGDGAFRVVKCAIDLTSGEIKAVAIVKQRLHGSCLLPSWKTCEEEVYRIKLIAQQIEQYPYLAQVDGIYFSSMSEKGDKYYILMPYYAGGDLNDALAGISQTRLDAITMAERLRIGQEIACGLSILHAKNLIHRDIKSENVFLEDAQGKRVRLGDFGFTCSTDDLVALGKQQGTAKSLAPELAAGMIEVYKRQKSHTQAAINAWWATLSTQSTDNWALGTVLFELFSIRPISFQNAFNRMHDQYQPMPQQCDRDYLYYTRLNGRNVQSLIDETIERYCFSILAPILKRLLRFEPGERASSSEIADVIATLHATC